MFLKFGKASTKISRPAALLICYFEELKGLRFLAHNTGGFG